MLLVQIEFIPISGCIYVERWHKPGVDQANARYEIRKVNFPAREPQFWTKMADIIVRLRIIGC